MANANVKKNQALYEIPSQCIYYQRFYCVFRKKQIEMEEETTKTEMIVISTVSDHFSNLLFYRPEITQYYTIFLLNCTI
jgi:hypothetical protein